MAKAKTENGFYIEALTAGENRFWTGSAWGKEKDKKVFPSEKSLPETVGDYEKAVHRVRMGSKDKEGKWVEAPSDGRVTYVTKEGKRARVRATAAKGDPK